LFNRPLLNAIASQAMRTIGDFHAQNLANTAWSFAALLYTHRPLLAAIAAQALRSMAQFSTQDLGNLSWAFAKLECAAGNPAYGRVQRAGSGHPGLV